MSEVTNTVAKQQLAPSRQRRMSKTLGRYARQLTLSDRSRRNLYQLADLTPKTRDRVFSALIVVTIALTLILPIVLSLFYFLLFVSPQYESEVRFVVRSAAPLLTSNRFSDSSLEPKEKIIQDTQVIISYLESRAAIDDLQTEVDFEALFGREDIDYFSRLDAGSSPEDKLEFWESMHSSWISPKSGIVELKLWAFSPEEAYNLVLLTLKLAEKRINLLNENIWSSLEESSKRNLEFATAELERLSVEIRTLREETGILDVESAAEDLSEIITELESELATLDVRRGVVLKSLSPQSRTVILIEREIAALTREIEKLRLRNTAKSESGVSSLSSVSKEENLLTVQMEIAEERFETALEEFERTKLLKSLQLVYIDRFTEPSVPTESAYPVTWVALLIVLIVSLFVCGTCLLVIVKVRNHLD